MKKFSTLILLALLGSMKVQSATFSSVSSGTWNAPATWTVTGVDADGIPDSDDDVTINGGHTVDLTGTGTFMNLTISPSGVLSGNGQLMNVYGNITNSGNVSGTLALKFFGSGIFSSSSTYTNPGDWYFYGSISYTIAAGTNIKKINYFHLNNTVTVTNLGSVQLTGSINLWNSSKWINGVNSSLQIGRDFGGAPSGGLDASASGNTVVYNSSAAAMNVYPTTYYNLSFSGASFWKTVQADLTVLNNFTLNSSAFNLNSKNITIGGNWNNLANFTIINQGIITFNGSGTQTIFRNTANEQFDNVVLNGSGTVLLNRSVVVNQSLTINSGTLDLNPSNIFLYIKGNLVNNGTLNCRQSTVTFNGTTAQTISGSSNTQFYNLTLSNSAGLTINSPQSLTNILTNSGGNFNSNGNFTLISDASKTARIAPVTGTGAFSGSMIIQKFISARAAGYHDLSSPVKNTTIMDWDNELYMSGIGADDGTPGPAGVDGTAYPGDGGATNSVWIYDETTGNVAPNNGWVAVTGSGTGIVSGKGYEVFLGDDLNNFSGATIDTRGVPQYATKTVNLSYTASQGAYAGANLIGNPYASAVNYSACTKTNVTGNILLLDNSGNYTDYGANPVIPAHQGFWITASGSGAKIDFLENAKSTSTSTSFFRTIPNYGIKLVFSSPNLPFYNENTINFESSANLGYDKELDALYIKSPNKNAPAMYMLTDSDARLITNHINADKDEVSIPLALFMPSAGIYYIEPNVLTTNNYGYSWIENTKTGEKFELTKSIPIEGTEKQTNTDYVLRLSKTSGSSTVTENVFDNDVVIFATENDVNLKSNHVTHYITNVSVFDMSGKLIKEENAITVEAGQTTKIDVSELSHGVYLVQATDILGHIKTQKIIR